jgi:hypothetical protein
MMDGETKPPRVWTMRQTFEPGLGWLVEGEMPECGDVVRVLEAEPVLDLLERARPILAEWKHGNSQSLLDVTAILQAHGRLDAT